MTDLVGKSLGRYHILEQLGEGGMATVYKAYDTRLEADVAVKVIRTENLTLGTMERTLKRFEREAKALARLTHPNIVKVTDYGEYEGKPYLVMEYLPSGTLKGKLNGKPMPWQEAAHLLIPVARALGFAHRQGMIHRDVKPANILITADGEPMLTDFGIAKLLDLEETMELTGTSAAVGTPEYMAPEQASSKNVDHRADIYSLGVVFYEMVTGRKPYTADTPMAVIIKQASEPLPRPRSFAPNLPQEAENILLKALAKNPNNRYQSMGEMEKVLRGLLEGKAGINGRLEGKRKEGTVRKDKKQLVLPAIPRRTVITVGITALVIGLLVVFSKSLSALPAQLLATSTPSNTPTLEFTPTPQATQTPLATATPELGIGSTMTGNDGMVMVYVPAGEFTMGSESNSDEQPIHKVYLDAFWIDQTEVTNVMYENCVNAGACVAPNNTGSYSRRNFARNNYFGNTTFNNHPVIFMDWNRASAYCEWADKRLPTEAEWEKAARGTDARTYPWGNEAPNNTLLNYNLNVGDATKVGSYESGKSPYGAYDMAGNVLEWVNDWYSETYYQYSPSSNPLGPDTGEYRVLRDSSWLDDEVDPRASYRGKSVPDMILIIIGVRCARGTSPP